MGMGSWGRGALYDMSDDLAFYSIAIEGYIFDCTI